MFLVKAGPLEQLDCQRHGYPRKSTQLIPLDLITCLGTGMWTEALYLFIQGFFMYGTWMVKRNTGFDGEQFAWTSRNAFTTEHAIT